MHVTPPLPLLKRVPPGAWTVLAWCGGAVFTLLMRLQLPGEWQATVHAGHFAYMWYGLLYQVVAAGLTVAGGVLLRRRPLTALSLLLTASVLSSIPLGVGEIPPAQFLAVDVALYFIAAGRSGRTRAVALAMALSVLAGYLTVRLLFGWNVGTSTELAVAMTAVIAWLIGHAVHQAHEHAERLSAQAAAQAVTGERLRIARELHDMVAHSIGIIALQAGAARRVIDTQPVRARDALGEIETVGRETLSGLRRMLGALRQAEPERAAPLAPAPGLADLERLAATTTEAGVRVEVRWLGERRPLPAEVDMSAYRIVQEAVTNVVRHAGVRSCRVSVGYGEEELAIEVLDSGRGRARAAGGGFGLAGMRERVGLLHGEFAAGPRPEGGFRVAARLPLAVGVR